MFLSEAGTEEQGDLRQGRTETSPLTPLTPIDPTPRGTFASGLDHNIVPQRLNPGRLAENEKKTTRQRLTSATSMP